MTFLRAGPSNTRVPHGIKNLRGIGTRSPVDPIALADAEPKGHCPCIGTAVADTHVCTPQCGLPRAPTPGTLPACVMGIPRPVPAPGESQEHQRTVESAWRIWRRVI